MVIKKKRWLSLVLFLVEYIFSSLCHFITRSWKEKQSMIRAVFLHWHGVARTSNLYLWLLSYDKLCSFTGWSLLCINSDFRKEKVMGFRINFRKEKRLSFICILRALIVFVPRSSSPFILHCTYYEESLLTL